MNEMHGRNYGRTCAVMAGMKRQLAAAFVVVAVFVNGCGSATSGDVAFAADVARASTSPADAITTASSINAFGLDLYRQVGTSGGNVVISPASVAIALAMARAGARGLTAAQMDTVLHGAGSDVNTAGINALDQGLAARTGTFPDAGGHALPVTLRIANAPFAQRDLSLAPAYLEALASRFGAGVRLVDYEADPEAARQLINAWVGGQTEGRIPELLGAGVITPLTRLTLVNAIYLKAAWETAFPAEATEPGSFTRAVGSSVNVPMMRLSAGLGYAEGSSWQAVELPYVGGSLALDVIVPADLATFEAGLTPQSLAAITTALQVREVDLALPKFSVQTATSLSNALKTLGMPLAFDPERADFSGITAQERLFIADVVHQANIDVDEKGTTASAASAVVMGGSAAPAAPVTLRVDHPFLFVLRDIPTGAIVFLGRVADPSTKG